jgi:hypothetical protein
MLSGSHSQSVLMRIRTAAPLCTRASLMMRQPIFVSPFHPGGDGFVTIW